MLEDFKKNEYKELIEAWEIKQDLHKFFNLKNHEEARLLLFKIVHRALSSTSEALHKFADKIINRFEDIAAANSTDISNTRVEATNTGIKLSIKRQYGSSLATLKKAIILKSALKSIPDFYFGTKIFNPMLSRKQ